MGEKEKEKRKSVMDGNVLWTISFVHQNQGKILLHTAIPIKGSPIEVHESPRENERDSDSESSPDSRETLVLLQAPCVLLLLCPYSQDSGTFGRA